MPLTELESKLCESIALKRESLIEQLARHVAIPTGMNYTPGLVAYQELLLDRLTALGAEIELIQGDPRPEWLDYPATGSGANDDGDETIPAIVIAQHQIGSDSPRVLLCGHLDTVHDPFGDFRELSIAEDGKTATGPGVVDMKGGLLVLITALETLHEAEVELNWTVVLNCDEERGSFQSLATLQEVAKTCDVGIVVEPALADGSLAIERMGSGQFRIEVTGQTAHVGREFERGISAVTKLGELMVEIGKMADPEAGIRINVGPISGGAVTNAVPDHAACWGNMRARDDNVAKKLDAMLEGVVTANDALPSVSISKQWNRPTKPLTDAVQKLADAARQAAQDLGQQLPFASTGGVCDGNVLQAAGLPTIDTLGVRGGNLHRTDEFIEIGSLVERSQLLAILLLRTAG